MSGGERESCARDSRRTNGVYALGVRMAVAMAVSGAIFTADLSEGLLTPASAAAAGLSGKAGPFKVVKPPPRGARKRLTIHTLDKSLPPSRRSSSRRQRHDWFWGVTSPSIEAADAARAIALSAQAGRRIGGGASASLVDRIRVRYGDEVKAAAQAAGISEALLISVVAAESAGVATAVSSAGAQGLAQLMPATAKRFGVSNAFDPAENLRGSAEYLNLLLKLFKSDAVLALAAYNAGENAVLRHKGVPPYAETRDYVPIVLSHYHAALRLCSMPQESPRDACGLK